MNVKHSEQLAREELINQKIRIQCNQISTKIVTQFCRHVLIEKSC